MQEYNSISAPEHYIKGRKYEPRKVIDDWKLNFNLGNVVKYISRAGRKDSILQDLEKARQYLTFEIQRIYSEEMTRYYEEFLNDKTNAIERKYTSLNEGEEQDDN